jgi:beta-N-acetylhexosaminidase
MGDHAAERELGATAAPGEMLADPASDAISRRDVLRGAALGGVALFLAACGSSGPSTPVGSASTGPSASVPDRSASPAPSSPSPIPTPTPPPDPLAPTLHQKIASLMIVGFRGAELADAPWLEEALTESRLGGVILFDRDQLTGGARNVVSPAQVKRLTDSVALAAEGRPLLIGVDQEGGIVTRLSPAHGFPALASEAKIGGGTAAAAKRWAKGLTTTLGTAGFDLNFAPVVDLNVNPSSPAIGALDRSFSADPDAVVAMATIEIDAHRAAGVLTTLKHFPGIGSSTTNTDFGVADVTKTWSRSELEPFRRLIEAGKADLIMAGHVVNGQIDAKRPASLSRATVTKLLRGELGWDGVVVTDDLQAAAITTEFGRDEAVLLAIEAGNDLLLFANQQVYDTNIVKNVVGVVASAVSSGRIDEARIDASISRVLNLFP